ncbi:MAG: ABC transporter permease [Acidobacteria bacterium]|nr:MAG: ABC transporter permease [Acidobacteriota bacterium]
MIRPRKAGVVASFEFLSTVRRVGYLVATFGMPVFVILYGGFIAGLGAFVNKRVEARASRPRVVAVVDEGGAIGLVSRIEEPAVELPPEVREAIERARSMNPRAPALAVGRIVFTPAAAEDEAKEALADGRIDAYYVLGSDYLQTGAVRFVQRETGFGDRVQAGSAFASLVRRRLLEGKVEEEILERVKQPVVRTERLMMDESGAIKPYSRLGKAAATLVPIVFTIMLFVSLMISAGYLVQGTALEKENRVVEVLLASADPDEILLGKLVGLGSAALLQVAVWLGLLILAGVLFAGALAAAGVSLPWAAAGLAVPYFLATYALLGSLMLGTGSLGGTMRESQQWSMLWTMLVALPVMFLGIMIPDPNGPVARALTWFPFSSGITVLLRLALEPEGVRWWEIAGSLALLAASTWFGIRFGARLFRIGLLLGGSRPRLREILRQARLG